MCKLCVFAGTSEGRLLASWLAGQPVSVTVCVATEYGESLLPQGENLTVSAKRLSREEMAGLFERESFDLVIDATHPYAQEVTENLQSACEETGVQYLRLLRPEGAGGTGRYFSDIPTAVRYLSGTEGTIYLTTGSKELAKFAVLPDFAQRVYARVLPMEASLAACREAGLPPAHIHAMQGPFSREMNRAALAMTGAKFLVTKEAGPAGGFGEKAQAAQDVGAELVVIGRPPQGEGQSLEETIALLEARFSLRRRPQVTVVGIGPGSLQGLTLEAHQAIREADCLIGAKRMLALAAPGQTVFPAIATDAIVALIRSHPEYTRFAVLMSGDTGFYSGAKKLLPLLSDCRVTVLPGISSLSALCARLGVSYEEIFPVSLHGRDTDILPWVARHQKVFALVGGEGGVAQLCARLTQGGFGEAQVTVGQNLGYPEEAIVAAPARELQERSFPSLSVALIQHDKPWRAAIGLPDEAFLRGEGIPMTKSEVRAVCLSKLALPEDAICWDVGAGTGSVSVEMALSVPRGQVYAIEKRTDALDLLEKNRERFLLENLIPVAGAAPEACRTLPPPSHVFLGGAGRELPAILGLIREKNPKARIVATAITLESVGLLSAAMADFASAEAVCVTVARDKKAGPYHLMMGQNPVYIFTFQN